MTCRLEFQPCPSLLSLFKEAHQIICEIICAIYNDNSNREYRPTINIYVGLLSCRGVVRFTKLNLKLSSIDWGFRCTSNYIATSFVDEDFDGSDTLPSAILLLLLIVANCRSVFSYICLPLSSSANKIQNLACIKRMCFFSLYTVVNFKALLFI